MQVDVAFDIDVAMPMYNLIEDIDNYSKTSSVVAVFESWTSLRY